MPWSSNATFLVAAHDPAGEHDPADPVLGVYKPGRGERRLWDFPQGLYRREVAAYVVSEALGWGIVPYTVRRDGPLGEGSVQRFVDADHAEHYFTLLEGGDESTIDQLRTICLFDFVVNNTDRKSGHCLLDGEGRVWAIDNGLSFHEEFKLRTVIWDFAREPIPGTLLADLAALAREPLDGLDGLLDASEVAAVRERSRALVEATTYPVDPTGRRYPWPLV